MNGLTYRLPPYRISEAISSLSPQERDWGLNQFRVPEAWRTSRGASVRVAVLDTGVDPEHSDLQGQIIAQRDFTGSRYGPADRHAHGTHCAGIIAARENGVGVVGVCPDLARDGGGLIVAKVLGDDGIGRGEWIARGIEWAVAENARVLSLSFGARQLDPQIARAVEDAAAAGALVIAAAGNDGGGGSLRDRVNYPARMRATLAVGAVGKDQLITEFSSRGEAVDIAAPGEHILSTTPGNRWARMSGTSMATPFVAGVVALVIAVTDFFGMDALRELLLAHA